MMKTAVTIKISGSVQNKMSSTDPLTNGVLNSDLKDASS